MLSKRLFGFFSELQFVRNQYLFERICRVFSAFRGLAFEIGRLVPGDDSRAVREEG